jgi:hypothetical protein
LVGIAGKMRPIQGSAPVLADDAYIRESIFNPYNRLSAGYTQTMPEYANTISEEEVLDLVAYIKSMGGPKSTSEIGPATGATDKMTVPPPVHAVGAIGARENPPSKSLAVGALNRQTEGR